MSQSIKKKFLIKELAHKVLKAVRNNENNILVKNLNSKLDIMLAKDATNAMVKLMQLKNRTHLLYLLANYDQSRKFFNQL